MDELAVVAEVQSDWFPESKVVPVDRTGKTLTRSKRVVNSRAERYVGSIDRLYCLFGASLELSHV